MSVTNERSTLSSSTVTRVTNDSDEKPVPKSSTEICTPIARSAASTSSTTSWSLTATDSVISSTSRPAPHPVPAQRVGDLGRQGGVEQAARRQVDRDGQVEAVRRPSRRPRPARGRARTG